jgi:signal transduction protein with GAF and PtsI domain
MPDDPALFEALYRISSILGSTDDPKSALEAMIDEILRVIPATSASINLINPDSQVLEIEVLRGLPEHSKQLQLSLGQGVTGWVALHGKPLLVPDVREDQRYVTVRDTIRSEMAAPMTDRGAIIGVINLDSDNTAAFTARDLERLERLSN